MKYIMLGLALSVVVLAYTTTEPYYVTVKGQRVLRVGFAPHIEANAVPVASVESNDWRVQLCHRLGNDAPSADILRFLDAWAHAEGGLSHNNPMNTTQPMPGATNFNSVGVKTFLTLDDGIEATAQTLQEGFTGYEDIKEGIRTNDPERSLRGLSVAPWGTNVANVEALYRQAPPRHTITTPEQIGARFTTTGDVWCQFDAQCRHLGTDYLAPQGSEVDLPYPATFLDTGSYTDDARYGDYVELTLDDGCVLYLGHLQNVPAFNAGQRYDAGTPVGQTNEKAHTHVQVRCNGQLVDFEQYQVSQK